MPYLEVTLKDLPESVLTAISWPGTRVAGRWMSNFSLPVKPRLSAVSPALYCRGTIPIPTCYDITVKD